MLTESGRTEEQDGSGLSPGTPDIYDLYHRIRNDILDGVIAAGSVVSQKRYADEFGVSRAKLREALRMLESEGLLNAQKNRRGRVPELSAESVDLLYAERILFDAAAAVITVPKLTDADLAELESSHGEMNAAWKAGDLPSWDHHHKRFHRLLVQRCPKQMLASIEARARHAERYRRFYLRRAEAWPRPLSSTEEHQELLHLAVRRSPAETARALARHYLRYGVALAALIDPIYEPVATRACAVVVGVARLR